MKRFRKANIIENRGVKPLLQVNWSLKDILSELGES